MELGWVDYSEADKKRVLDVLESFKVEGAVDELGIGVIRDAFSDYFFPGTSTLHTKAKYFFIIPYIIKNLEFDPEKDIKALRMKMDAQERDCARQMLEQAKASHQSVEGIIGNQSLPNNWVASTPSVMYWAGLQRYGFIKKCSDGSSISINPFLRIITSSGLETVRFGSSVEEAETGSADDKQYFQSFVRIPLDDYRALNVSLSLQTV